MSRYNDYEDSGYRDREYNNRGYQKSHKREGIFSELLGEIPIIGDLFESLNVKRLGSKGFKKICCCVAPICLIVLFLLVGLVFWVIKSGLNVFKIDTTNMNWLEQGKNWLNSFLSIEQISTWFTGFSTLFGM